MDFRHIMAAAWWRKVVDIEPLASSQDFHDEHKELEVLALRASEINVIHSKHVLYLRQKLREGYSRVELEIELDYTKGLQFPCSQSVPNRVEILDWMMKEDYTQRLVVTPILDLHQISDGAVDVRLGNEFIVMKKTAFAALDIGESSEQTERKIGQYQDKNKIDFGDPFVLHPNELVLGSTMEFISLPNNLFAYVLSRSSWGRLGLLIATATAVNPGYKGCLTLELINLGEVPITLYPGLPIAQLILHRSSDGVYRASYKSPTGPEFSNVFAKPFENEFWSSPYKKRD